MPPRKRGRDEMETSEPPKEMSLLDKIRNMWEFASVMQFIFMFGKAVKIDDDFDIEDFETECLKPGSSDKLEDIGLTLLKFISSHRGLTLEIWDEYARRQYVAKAPPLNPYGDDEQPNKFRDFDIFQKIRTLHQLSVWTFWNPDRIRERMPEHQREVEQLEWRVEEFGYDREERNYYLLDDNRLYRRTEPPLPPPPKAKSKANSLKAQAARRRASKRRRVIEDSETPETHTGDEAGGESQLQDDHVDQDSLPTKEQDTFGGFKWECLAITRAQYDEFCDSLKSSKDPNEKELRTRVLEDVMPIIEQAEDKQRRKAERKGRELMALEKLATAKRSSRLADKHDKERQAVEQAEADRKRAHDLQAAHREQERQSKMEQDRQSRMMTREQRIKDREYKRILHEEELARMAEEAKKVEAGESRASERRLKEKMERTKKDLEDLKSEEDWTFDCSGCGVHGKNLDDGSHSVACEKCSVWQHSKCLGISKAAAEKDDFHFVCRDCQRREEDAKKPKIPPLKFRAGLSSSPPQHPSPARISQSPSKPTFHGVVVPKTRDPSRPPSHGNLSNGYGNLPPLSGSLSPTVHYRPHPGQQPGHPPHTNGHAQRPGSSSQSPPLQPNNYPGPPRSPYSPYYIPSQQYQNYPPQARPAHRNYHHGVPHEYQTYPYQPQQTPQTHNQYTPRPASSPSNANGNTASPAYLPSPILNRPVMSPSQGNYETSAVAGVPHQTQPSPSLNYHPALFTPSHPQQLPMQQAVNGVHNHPHHHPSGAGHPVRMAGHMSGLSPTKHSPPLPVPVAGQVPQKLSYSPPPSQSRQNQQQQQQQQQATSTRSVSGTPLFPPAQTLAPSPEQLSKSPVPTPSKGATPAQVGEGELRRVTMEVQKEMAGQMVLEGSQRNGSGNGRST